MMPRAVARPVAARLRVHQPLRGYTLVELLVVLAVLGTLAGMLLPLAEITVQRDREAELKRALWEIRDALDAYKRASDLAAGGAWTASSGYPPSLEALTQGAADPRGGRRIYFLRRIPRDPFADPTLPPALTWGLRGYDSPPEAPRPGADVYDVYSKSTKQALNGTPLGSW